MVFFFITKKPRVPKGIVSPAKLMRIKGLRDVALKRVNKIQADFNSTPVGKKLQENIETSRNAAEEMLTKKRNLKQSLVDKNKIKLAISKNATRSLLYLTELKEFAVSKNANHKFINHLDKLIDTAQDRVVQAREWTP